MPKLTYETREQEYYLEILLDGVILAAVGPESGPWPPVAFQVYEGPLSPNVEWEEDENTKIVGNVRVEGNLEKAWERAQLETHQVAGVVWFQMMKKADQKDRILRIAQECDNMSLGLWNYQFHSKLGRQETLDEEVLGCIQALRNHLKDATALMKVIAERGG